MMDLSILSAILCIIVLGLVYWLAVRNSSYWENRGVEYIKSAPIFGVMLDILLSKRGFGEIILDIYKKLDGKKYGGYFVFTVPTVMIRDPELINRVLIKDFTYFENRSPPLTSGKDLFSLNLSNLCGNKWRNARHKLTPTFTSGKLKMMFGPVRECSEEAADYIKDSGKIGQDIDAKDFMLRCNLNVIANVAFGLKLNTLNIEDKSSTEFYKHASKFFQPSFLLLIRSMIFMSLPKLKDIFNVKFIDSEVENFFRALTTDIIKYRETTSTKRNDFLHLMLDLKKKEDDCLKIGELNSNTITSNENETMDSDDKELMDQLKNTPLGSYDSNLSGIFTEEFLAAQTFLFISGGSETTAGALSFVLYELAMNQEVQKKVQNEISNVLSTQELNYQAVGKMTYLEQCIYETMRLFPAIGGLNRVCNRNYKIPGTDINIEKGTNVVIPILGLHSDPQYFPDPEKFNPDRFEDMDAIPKGVYFPFGGGPRICIAMRLAMLEMKIVLATFLQNYSVTISEKTKLPLKLMKHAFMPRAEGGIWLKFHKRE